jgi:hypothetical protein
VSTLLKSITGLLLAFSVDAAAAPKKASGKDKGKASKSASTAKRERASEDEKPRAKKGKQDLKFSGLKLKGDLKKPDLSYIYKRRGLKNEQIVNIPTDFEDEIRQGENQF